MTTLAHHVSVSARFARSANLERDVTSVDPLDGYIVTARAVDVVDRLVTRATSSASGGAWSITGPYGSGKSSLALLIDGAFGEDGKVRSKALDLIGAAAPDLRTKILNTHKLHGTTRSGFCLAVATASREPISHTVLRALRSAVIRRFGRIPLPAEFKASQALTDALADEASDDPRRTGPSPAALLAVARCLAESAPLLIVIDEFGKNLEAVTSSADSDPYLLQQLAEAGQGDGAPIFTLTLQHLSFEDYFTTAGNLEHREWAKVQGRFEDVPFADSPAETRALIATVFDVDDALHKQVDTWAEGMAKAMGKLGLEDLSTRDAVANCFPLHPLAAAALPELCSRYGQNERTLFSFLAGNDASAVPAVLARRDLTDTDPLPAIGLSEVYDYFIEGEIAGSPGVNGSRWREIATCLRDAHGLSAQEWTLAKSIAILNLVGASGTIRASKTLLGQVAKRPAATLRKLEQRGLITYRAFADEYRIWKGSDLDVRSLVEGAAVTLAKLPLIEVLSRFDPPTPVIAARHSAEHDTLRVFARRYATTSEVVKPLSPFSEVDGQLLLLVDSESHCPTIAETGLSKPIVAALPTTIAALDTTARSLAAIHQVLDLPEVASDWVVRSELGEQLAQAETLFHEAFISTFDPQNCAWFLLTEDGAEPLTSGRGTAALSAAADQAYQSAPRIGNEMINRTALTSQGAKARSMLLAGMIERASEVDLGFEGHGPEVAMYRAVLERTGLHRGDSQSDARVFDKPKEPSLLSAWRAMEGEFRRSRRRRVNLNDLYAVLMSPPIGMKAAVVPVFATAGLLVHANEIAIYEHGTFKPVLSPEISERMVRNPSHFEVKHFANTTGARRQVIDELAARLGVRPAFRKHRVENVLAIVGHLVSRVNRLDNYTLHTRNLPEATKHAREALVTAIEPDELLFEALPEALGFKPVPADTKSYAKARAYADSVGEALEDLTGCLDNLLGDLYDLLLEESGETSRLAILGQAAALENEVLDPEVRAFVLSLANDGFHANSDWIKAVAMVVANKAPAEWNDDDLVRFQRVLPEHVAAFHRLMALHAERRADGGGPFHALRMTATQADGSENALLVGVEQSSRPVIEQILDDALVGASGVTGSPRRAVHAFLALLGERMLLTGRSEERTSATEADLGLEEAASNV